MPLVVVTAFPPYASGQRITDPALIASIVAGPNKLFVVAVAPDFGGSAPASTTSGSGASQPATGTGLPTLVVAADLRAGMPVTFSRAAGRLVAARSDTKALSFVMGLLTADVASGFAAAPSLGVVTLPDWTAATGAAALVPGVPYYLDAAGGLTASPDRTAIVCIATVGVSLSTTTLMVAPTSPIQL